MKKEFLRTKFLMIGGALILLCACSPEKKDDVKKDEAFSDAVEKQEEAHFNAMEQASGIASEQVVSEKAIEAVAVQDQTVSSVDNVLKEVANADEVKDPSPSTPSQESSAVNDQTSAVTPAAVVEQAVGYSDKKPEEPKAEEPKAEKPAKDSQGDESSEDQSPSDDNGSEDNTTSSKNDGCSCNAASNACEQQK